MGRPGDPVQGKKKRLRRLEGLDAAASAFDAGIG
jgi:hypothetical protein